MNDELKNGTRVLHPPSREAWRRWLELNHQSGKPVWLVIQRKHSPVPGLKYRDAVDEALCFGWIDGKMNPCDDNSFYQYFTQRKPRSSWSKINKQKVEELAAKGLMAQPGFDMVRKAKANGQWDKTEQLENLEVPELLWQLLIQNPQANQNWEGYSDSSKKRILEWIFFAKKEITRQKRIEAAVIMAEHNKRLQ